VRPISFLDYKLLAKNKNFILAVTEVEFKSIMKKRLSAPSKEKIPWKCEKGHLWWATYNNIKQHNSGCPYCYGNKAISYNSCLELAKLKNLEVLTSQKKYQYLLERQYSRPSKIKLKWSCNSGHAWYACYDHIKNANTSCPHCYGNTPITYMKYKSLARKRGFKIHTTQNEFKDLLKSKKSVPSKMGLNWKCTRGHIWKAPYNDIQQGKGCPKCSVGKYERICRWYFERIFGYKFDKVNLSEVIPYYKGRMHLDGYAIIHIQGNDIELAFEYNGLQHLVYPNFFHKSYDQFLSQQKVDQKKKELCKENEIFLITFPQTVDMKMNHPKTIQNYIIAEFQKETGYSLPKKVRQYNHLNKRYTTLNRS
jgi:hypothetical protein